MNVREFEQWAKTPGREVFTANSKEIDETIRLLKKFEDLIFDLYIELCGLKGEPGPHHGN